MLKKIFAVGRIGKRHVQGLGIVQSLIHAVPCHGIVFFGLHYGQRLIAAPEQQVVRFFTRGPLGFSAMHLDAAICKIQFHADPFLVPARIFKSRSDIAQFRLFLAQGSIVDILHGGLAKK